MIKKPKKNAAGASLKRRVSLTTQQKLMLCDAAKDGGSYQCVSREWQVARNLDEKGLGSMWHDVFEINDAGRAAVGLPPANQN